MTAGSGCARSIRCTAFYLQRLSGNPKAQSDILRDWPGPEVVCNSVLRRTLFSRPKSRSGCASASGQHDHPAISCHGYGQRSIWHRGAWVLYSGTSKLGAMTALQPCSRLPARSVSVGLVLGWVVKTVREARRSGLHRECDLVGAP